MAWGQQYQFDVPYQALVRDWVSARSRQTVERLCNAVLDLPSGRGANLDRELWTLHRAYTTMVSPEKARKLCSDPRLMIGWKESYINYDDYHLEMLREQEILAPAIAEALRCSKYPFGFSRFNVYGQ